VGQGALARADGPAVLALAAQIARNGERDAGWNGLAVLHTAAGRVGGLDIGFVPAAGALSATDMVRDAGAGALDVLFLLGADEIDTAALGGAFVVYIGSHGDAGAQRADVILPGAAYTEKAGTLVNTEGRVQRLKRAAFPPGDAREDWAILRALSDVLGRRLPFDSFGELRAKMVAAHPHLGVEDGLVTHGPEALDPVARSTATLGRARFDNAIRDFYLTNAIARASAVMAECSALAAGRMAEAAE
jgi:NADH-quinone oxidoreductase subunit G